MSKPGPVKKHEFTRACAQFATGVTIASVRDEHGTAHGLTVNSFTSVALVPPLILICVGHETSVIQYFRKAGHFGISMLSEEQQDLSERFARKGKDRFEKVDWAPGVTGVPLVSNVIGAMECAARERFTVGDHDIFIGEVVHTMVREGRPLLYFGSQYRRLA